MSRADRVSALLQEKISTIIRREIDDPRIGFVSITGVDISPDLSSAKIFVSIFGEKAKQVETMAGLRNATSFIRGKLGLDLALRDVPEIRFVHDTSLERGSRVLGLLNKIQGKDDVKTNRRSAKKG